MASPATDPRLLLIDKFGGINTNAARGAHTQPTVLENVYLERTGGYSPQFARSQQLTSVQWAWTAGLGTDLFYLDGSGTFNYYDAPARVSTSIPGVTGANTAVPLMPGLIVTSAASGGGYTNQYIYKPGITPGGGIGAPGSFTFTYTAKQDGEVAFGSGVTYDFVVVYSVPDPQVVGHFAQARTFTFQAGSSVGSPPPTEFIPVIDFPGTGIGSTAGAVYYRQAGLTGPWRVGAILPGTTRVQMLDLGVPTGTVGYFSFVTSPTMPHEYHQGRVWVSPSSYQFFDGSGPGVTTEGIPNRLFYSEVIAAASLKASPTFSVANFIDVPFRVSRRIVALLSVASYLYVFGDREVFLLTGDPSTGRLESIGDSIGAVSPGSVQQLDGIGYWLSDSGVMAVRGGQVQDVGNDVRDLLVNLDLSNVSSTVDFARDLYLLTDGTITLCYHTGQQAWTTRQQTESGTLVYGAGTPYAIAGSVLYSLGGEPSSSLTLPQRLVVTVQWGPFECGDWMLRKNFRRLFVGLDLATENATVTNQTLILSNLPLEEAQTILPGSGRVAFNLSDHGLPQSGVSVQPRLIYSTQDSRGILRPPLAVHGVAEVEQEMP